MSPVSLVFQTEVTLSIDLKTVSEWEHPFHKHKTVNNTFGNLVELCYEIIRVEDMDTDDQSRNGG